jgi:phenylpropionate dioxygenase-like ring-hydroxylating dioxygenase large terminal subunit
MTKTKHANKIANTHRPYSGYFLTDVPPPDDELTSVGPGTPMGEYMRRFWHPLCLSEELKDLPKATKILGQELVMFRDKSNRVGVLHKHCSHRGSSLEYGMVSERGLRCCYHGWLYDVDGTILETPGEPPDSTLKDRFFHGAYPTYEYKGIVFAYFGPPDDMPAFPIRDVWVEPDVNMVPFSLEVGNNWLQTQENNLDPSHSSFLHTRVTEHFAGSFTEVPRIDYQVVGDGTGVIYSCKRRLGDYMWVRQLHTFLPNESHVGTVYHDGTSQLYFQRALWSRWITPRDDTSAIYLGWRHFGNEYPGGREEECGLGKIDMPGQVKVKDYEESQRFPGDWEAQASQRSIAVHSLEHMGTTDGGVALIRKALRDALHGNAPKAWPNPNPNGVVEAKPVNLYTEDTVLKIPPTGEYKKEWALLGEVGDRVSDIIFDADRLSGRERIDHVQKELKELEASYN